MSPLSHTGRDNSPSWSACGTGGPTSPGTKEYAGAIELLYLTHKQRCLLRAADLDTDFLLCIIINSKTLCIPKTGFL